MKTDIDTQLIKELLDTSTRQITPATLEKLRGARTRALDHQRARSTAPVLAWLGPYTGKNNSFGMSKAMSWAVAVLFVACLISGATLWHSYSTEREINELDIAILTGDLPIHIYLD